LAMQRQPHVIGCDAGSTDPGPFYLGSGRPQASRAATKRDLQLILRAGRAANIPVIIGSAGTAGGDPHLALTRDIVEDIAREDGLSFKFALIHAELEPAFLKQRLRAGRIHPLKPAPGFDEDTIDRGARFVAQMGAEPFMQALEQGADVILAGRASDTSIYAAYPLVHGCAPGPVWHAAKILECGAASVTQRLHPDPLMAWVHDDDFVVEPPHPGMRCTPNSVVAHTLYENADPFRLCEPAGVLDTSGADYEAISDRAVRVTGSRFEPAERYTVRIEGAEYLGHRFAVIAGVRDPVVLRQHDQFLASLRETIGHKTQASLGLTIDRDYRLVYRVYGQNGSMGALEPDNRIEGHEIGLVVEAIGRTAEEARAVITVAWHTGLHHPVPEWEGLISNWAFPYSPPEMDCGPVYRFCVNHVVELDEPTEVFRIEYAEIGQPALVAV
jgi:Acyclic terpene utilisation family protein AtuA